MFEPWVVLKFGGTSVASKQRWARVAERIKRLRPGHRVWVVASALGGVSNMLEQAIDEALGGDTTTKLDAIRELHQGLAVDLGLRTEEWQPVERLFEELEKWLTGVRLTGEATPRLRAKIMSVGELAATRLGTGALAHHEIEARWVDSRKLLVSDSDLADNDDQRFLEATVVSCENPEAGERAAESASVVLGPGFIARTPEGETCLLGRGGSDTSAALIAALLQAERLEIWTDVHGLFTADPRLVPVARLIRRIGYREAQELAAMGARVLHPRCLEPVSRFGIPLEIHSTDAPEREGTRIEAEDEDHPVVTAVTCRSGVTLLSLSTLSMWRSPGFLARAFAHFEELGISIDLVATSQSAISVTLDNLPGGTTGKAFDRLIKRLEQMGTVDVIHPCAVVSIVGRRIRAALHELGAAMTVFQERPVHLVSDSTEDLNISFVVDEEDGRPLVARLHERLFAAQGGSSRFGATFEMLEAPEAEERERGAWWRQERERLLDLVKDGRPRYVYHLPTVRKAAGRLVDKLPSAARISYSMKANPHRRVLETIVGEGLSIECVSAAEVHRAREILGSKVPILFTPNFCPIEEYAAAFEAGADVVVDGPDPLRQSPETFRKRSIGLRVDPGRGLGHHEKVRTAGAQTKFGQPVDDMEPVKTAAAEVEAKIVGLHAHVGSGILDPEAWAATGRVLATILYMFPDVEWLDLGGGLGVPERPGQDELDLPALDRSLNGLRKTIDDLSLFLEPGRFLVSEAGVLVVPVTQVRQKAGLSFAGLATGMNSLIRPALYGAWHGIHNLSRLNETADSYWQVVGPICETGDVFGRDRLLPDTRPGDVLIIENVGAYGAVMGSSYNLRERAEEVVLELTGG